MLLKLVFYSLNSKIGGSIAVFYCCDSSNIVFENHSLKYLLYFYVSKLALKLQICNL